MKNEVSNKAPVRTEAARRQIAALLNEQIAKDGRRLGKLSSDAGLSQGMASSWTNKGSGVPWALAALCRELGIPVLQAFQIAGWLTPDEIEGRIPDYTPRAGDAEVIQAYRTLDESQQRLVRRGLGLPAEPNGEAA